MLNIPWSRFEQVKKKIGENESASIDYIMGNPHTKTLKVNKINFLSTIWKLFDNSEPVDFIRVSVGDQCLLRFKTNKEPSLSQKLNSNTNYVFRYWNKLSSDEKKANLKILWSQIAYHN